MFDVIEQDWLPDAICGKVPNRDQFHPAPKESADPAREVCLACPVRLLCLKYAIDNREPAGVWGGLRPDERRAAATDLAAGRISDVSAVRVRFDGLRVNPDAGRDQPETPDQPETVAVPATSEAPVIRDTAAALADLLEATEGHPDRGVRELRRLLVSAGTALASAHDRATQQALSPVA